MRTIFANLWKLYVGVIFSVLAVLTYPVLFLLLLSEKGKRKAFAIFTAWSWLMRVCCLYFVRVRGNRKSLPTEPVVIISNHSSYLDIFLMYSILPHHPFLFLGKAEILKYPLIKTYFKRLNIPVFRNDKVRAGRSFIQSLQAVRNGWSLVIFPEGGIADEALPALQEFKDGAFVLAKKTGVPVLPLTFLDNYHLFSDPGNWTGQAHPGLSRVVIHDIIPAEKVASMTAEELKQTCFDTINSSLLEHYPHLRKIM